MVEYALSLDEVFGSLADPTRRDILRRVAHAKLSVGEIAQPYHMSLAAISKHLKVLEKARLIRKQRRGTERVVSLSPDALAAVDQYLNQYRQFWEDRLQLLEVVLEQEMNNNEGGKS